MMNFGNNTSNGLIAKLKNRLSNRSEGTDMILREAIGMAISRAVGFVIGLKDRFRK